jgi:hypothetical protein
VTSDDDRAGTERIAVAGERDPGCDATGSFAWWISPRSLG